MGELVFIQNDRILTDSLAVAREFEKTHDNVMRDIRVQIDKLIHADESEWGSLNFEETTYVNEQNHQTYHKFLMTRDAFTLVTMSYTTPKAMKAKIKYIDEFNKMKHQMNNLPSEMPTHAQALRGWADAIEEKEELEDKNKQLTSTIEEQKPKVLFAETCQASKSSILVRELAKLASDEGVKIGQNRLYRKLRQWGYIMKYSTEPTQRAMDSEYFEVIQRSVNTPEGTKLSRTTKVTPKGQIRIINRLKAETNVLPMEVAK